MISVLSFFAFLLKCFSTAITPLCYYMDNVSSPASSPLGRVKMEQLVIESPDTIMGFPSFSARIDAAAIAFYGALDFAPVTNLLMFTDACVERIEKRYRQDVT